jgi:hypothetical protein
MFDNSVSRRNDSVVWLWITVLTFVSFLLPLRWTPSAVADQSFKPDTAFYIVDHPEGSGRNVLREM